MFLGTSRVWWIATGLLFVLGLILVSTDVGGVFGTPIGVLMVLLAMIVFAAAPRRRPSSAQDVARPAAGPPVVEPVIEPPRPRPQIEGRDASEV